MVWPEDAEAMKGSLAGSAVHRSLGQLALMEDAMSARTINSQLPILEFNPVAVVH